MFTAANTGMALFQTLLFVTGFRYSVVLRTLVCYLYMFVCCALLLSATLY